MKGILAYRDGVVPARVCRTGHFVKNCFMPVLKSLNHFSVSCNWISDFDVRAVSTHLFVKVELLSILV